MKKKILLLLFIVIILTVGCSSESGNSGSKSSTEFINQDSSVKTEKKEKKADKINIVKKGDTFNTKSYHVLKSKDSSIEDQEINLELEITILDYGYHDQVFSESDNPYSFEFVDEEDETYYVVELLIKNKGPRTVHNQVQLEPRWWKDKGQNYINEFIYQENYKYNWNWVDPSNLALSSFFSIEPLKELKVFMYASIPDELTDAEPEVFFSIGFEQFKIKP